jgi:hypothetical protein
MEGGTLRVRVDEDLGVVLRGPVRAVCDGEIDAGFARVLGGGRLPGPDAAAGARPEETGEG